MNKNTILFAFFLLILTALFWYLGWTSWGMKQIFFSAPLAFAALLPESNNRYWWLQAILTSIIAGVPIGWILCGFLFGTSKTSTIEMIVSIFGGIIFWNFMMTMLIINSELKTISFWKWLAVIMIPSFGTLIEYLLGGIIEHIFPILPFWISVEAMLLHLIIYILFNKTLFFSYPLTVTLFSALLFPFLCSLNLLVLFLFQFILFLSFIASFISF